MHRTMLFLLALATAGALHADKAATFFDDTKVQEVRLYFDDTNWYNTLYNARSQGSDTYYPARFQYGDTVIDQIGVRFKGNASFRRNGVKKSFKLDFNEYDDEAKFVGMKKLNLNNGDLQPDFLREKLFLDFASKYITAMRAVHTRVYVNDVYWGLYIAVEEPDKEMMQNRFGDDEDGNLYEAGESNATLAYLGTNQSSYEQYYELKTNETANDFSDLINFTNVLNNTATASLPAALEPICDVNNMLYGIAMNILFVNLDSYAGSASEFMLYHRQDTDQFVHIHWDLNESFGTTGDGSPSIATPAKLDLFYLPTSSSMGGGSSRPGGSTSSSSSANSRPLMSKLWAVDTYKRTYLRMLARMLREGFDTTSMQTRITELADIIRTDVYADTNKAYTNAQFETALNNSVSSGGTTLQGLTSFVTSRASYVRTALDAYAAATDMRLNEVMSNNTATLADEAGDYDPWVEIHNLGPGTLSTGTFYLTDDQTNPTKFVLPSSSLADGGFLTVWLDGESAEGDNHASFRLSTSGGTLYLYYKTATAASATLIDSVEYPELNAGRSYIRLGDSGSNWAQTLTPTPSATNPTTGISSSTEPVVLYINEFMASNKTTLVNPDDTSAYDDWIEIYNPGTSDVDMGGMYLTDNLSNPTKWQIPSGVVIPAGGYLLFWADEKTTLGSLHAGFKLSADGEEIGLYMSDGSTAIDTLSFGAQTADVSYGRNPDGSSSWTTFSTPTPGKSNN
jgi:spore coat protein CotH